jgi:hypothetical protein
VSYPYRSWYYCGVEKPEDFASRSPGQDLATAERVVADRLAEALNDPKTLAQVHEQLLLIASAQLAPVIARFAASMSDPTTPMGAAVADMQRMIADQAALIGASALSSYRAVLYNVAVSHHGYVTTDMAIAAGVPAVEVRKLAHRGGLTNIARGLYRVDGIDGGERAPFAEAVHLIGQQAHLHGDSVLAFHNLAFVNPRHIAVGTPRRVRRKLPDHIRLVHETVDPEDLTEYDSVPSTTVERAIRDCIGAVMPERLAEATQRSADEGLIRRRQAAALLAQIRSAA